MSDMNILSQMIKEAALVQKEKEHGKLFVVLNEPQAQDSSATIRHLPHDALVIKVDAFRSPDTIFNGTNGECKRADYVIISEEKRCILYIEMKRTKDGRNETVKQLQGAHCFVRYCQEVGKSFWKKDDFLDNYNNRFISIGRTSIAITSRERMSNNKELHDTPDKAMKIDCPRYLQYNKLAGAGS